MRPLTLSIIFIFLSTAFLAAKPTAPDWLQKAPPGAGIASPSRRDWRNGSYAEFI